MNGYPGVLVMGAGGNVGSAVLAGLRQSEGSLAVYAGRSGSGQRSPLDRPAPFDDRQQLLAALAGVDRTFLMVPFGGRMREWAQRFVDCALAQGVRFIVRLSGLAAAPDSGSAMGRLQAEVDAIVRDSGIDCCILRCNSFMQNFAGMYRLMLLRDRLALAHGEARISFIDTRDIGRAAANILLDPEPYRGAVLDLDGPEALDNHAVARLIGAAVGREVRYTPISEEKACAGYRRIGLPEWEVEVFRSLDRYLREGHAAGGGDTLAAVLGRPPATLADYVSSYRERWLG
ncbi:MAG: NmrA family NAD(P)-binding protein [Parahaliea sp.]